jgi:hypothetical protein
MKKILVAFAFAASLSACHYGTDEAQKTLKANEQYKSDKADYSINRANVTAEADKEADKEAATVDTTAAVTAPVAPATVAPASH